VLFVLLSWTGGARRLPYTTLFRSSQSVSGCCNAFLSVPTTPGVVYSVTVVGSDNNYAGYGAWTSLPSTPVNVVALEAPSGLVARSEEHTSELQSQSKVACPLRL